MLLLLSDLLTFLPAVPLSELFSRQCMLLGVSCGASQDVLGICYHLAGPIKDVIHVQIQALRIPCLICMPNVHDWRTYSAKVVQLHMIRTVWLCTMLSADYYAFAAG